MKKYIAAILFILISQLAGLIGSVFTVSAIPNWYANLIKPSFNPPNWLFGPVWLVLYTMMGIAAFLIWQKRDSGRLAKLSLVLFFVHLIFNAAWSILFFGLESPMLALIDIAVLWVMILVLIFLYFDIDRRAAYLMLPYLAWVSFATVLNYSILTLNN